MISTRAGSCHRAKPCSSRWARTLSAPTGTPETTTQAGGRSTHRGSGMATTAASTTPGMAMMAASMSTEEIHSPPDLIRSLVRSVMTKYPSGDPMAMSPVSNHPSSVKLVAPCPWR